jgi:hypothetical protein
MTSPRIRSAAKSLAARARDRAKAWAGVSAECVARPTPSSNHDKRR